MTGYYAEKLEQGLRFQDFVMRALHGAGIVLQPISSRSGQLTGENLLGLEIKFDDRHRETGNLFIETHEKSAPENAEFVCSGILRNDNSWLYGIGNYSRFWIFAKTTLRVVYNRLLFEKALWDGVVLKEIPTARGFILPSKLADAWAAKVVDFEKDAQ
jgi:hypothetical protein